MKKVKVKGCKKFKEKEPQGYCTMLTVTSLGQRSSCHVSVLRAGLGEDFLAAGLTPLPPTTAQRPAAALGPAKPPSLASGPGLEGSRRVLALLG